MNALVKKEIRLLLPAWTVAVLLAMVQAITRPYDFYVASLLFFGLTIMGLSSIGRETSLNTFSSLLAQPAERIRIWQVKLTVLAVAFLVVFVVWLAAFGIAYVNSHVDESDRESSYNLFITICLIATATFTGGLWTTLLLRQVAGAFWLTLLVPATLSGFSAVFFARSDSENLVIAVLSVVIGIYSIAGFFFARRLYFRAQDVGWSGGVIVLPEWKFSARDKTSTGTRARKPISALLKKEFLLQQGALTGAAGLLVIHIGIVLLRTFHNFEKNSPGEALTSIFWMLWLVLPVIVGCNAVAEERKAGVMESQLCLPASRRVQFVIKAFVTLFLGVFLGGVMPVVVEGIGISASGGKSAFTQPGNDLLFLTAGIVGFAAWLGLVSFFASSLAKSFLQAVGFGVGTFFGCMVVIPVFTDGRMLGLDRIPTPAVLPLIIAVPTIIVMLIWLAYLNFKDFREGWLMWRRILTGLVTALLFIFVCSNLLYHRAWEVLESAEPAHGPAKLSSANLQALHAGGDGDLLAYLPEGRLWCDYVTNDKRGSTAVLKWLWSTTINPFVKSAGAQRHVGGSNYISATVQHVDFETSDTDKDGKIPSHLRINGYLETVGIKADGTLWVSEPSNTGEWTGDKMSLFGGEKDWRQVVGVQDNLLLLKNNGTLWHWGIKQTEWPPWNWPSLRNTQPLQIGTDADWAEIYDGNWVHFARKLDGTVWKISVTGKKGEYEFIRDTNLDQVSFQTLSLSGGGSRAYVRRDGTLWMSWMLDQHDGRDIYSAFAQIGTNTTWVDVALNWNQIVALKSDGSLWRWDSRQLYIANNDDLIRLIHTPPSRMGIHNDWVALAKLWDDTITLAADGTVWLWPDHNYYEQYSLLKLPKQPRLLDNVFGAAN